MNQKDIEAAQRLIAQFEGGTGRHNSASRRRLFLRIEPLDIEKFKVWIKENNRVILNPTRAGIEFMDGGGI